MAYGSTSSPAIARWGAGIAGAAAALIGAFWLAAWLMGFGARWSASGVLTVKTNMAVGLVLSGAALLLLATGGATSWHRRLGAAAAAVVLLIGAATLSEYLVGWDLGIDQLLATEPAGAVATASPNRIGLPGSTCLMLLGTGLLAVAWGRRSQVVTRYLGLAVCLIVLVPLVGFLYGVHEFYDATRLTGIAWPTTIAMLLLGIGLMLARPEAGPASLLLREDAGAVLLRRMLPAAVLVPLALGFVRRTGPAPRPVRYGHGHRPADHQPDPDFLGDAVAQCGGAEPIGGKPAPGRGADPQPGPVPRRQSQPNPSHRGRWQGPLCQSARPGIAPGLGER